MNDSHKVGNHHPNLSIPRFRRRIFLVKNRFQFRFALFPIFFFLLFLLGAGGYLWWYINDTLQYYIYMPHCRIDNIWPEVSPAIVNTAVVGGAAFIVAMGAWIFSKYRPLKREIAALDEWTTTFDAESGRALAAGMKDQEMRLLTERLAQAAEQFGKWEAEANSSRAEFLEAAKQLLSRDDATFMEGAEELREKWRTLLDKVNHVRVDERLS